MSEEQTWPTETRAEALAWCKERALEYIDQGDVRQGITSMASDLRKSPHTAEQADESGVMCLTFLLTNPSPEDARLFIEDFR